MHVYKTYQLQLIHTQGIRVPRTLVSNDPEAVQAFCAGLENRVIYKPVRGGAHTTRIQAGDLAPERLKELRQAPVQFQEMIEGVDVRAYLIGDEIFAGEIRSKNIGDTVDFRADPDAEIVPIQLPDAIATQCRQIAQFLGLVYTGIDIRRTPDGEHVFLEANPAPMFIHFEKQANYPISDRLVDLLLGD